MAVKKALEFFKGSGGKVRFNCAQAVAKAFMEKFELSDNSTAIFASYGSGKAPGGVCGALYAAQTILQKMGAKKVAEADQLFSDYTGSIKCSDIRRTRKVSCMECVKKAAEILDET
jgi:hypothetical protein